MSLVTEVYKTTQMFPDTEKFGLTNQVRRCAVSIPSNISEGCGRNSNKELVQFLSISLGSAFELETQLIVAQELEYIKKESSSELLSELNEIQKMTKVFIDHLKSKY